MFQQNVAKSGTSFGKLGFTDRVWKCLDRANRHRFCFRTPDSSTVFEMLDQVRKTTAIASNEVVNALRAKNPSVIQIASSSGDTLEPAPVGLLAILPLNTTGFEALVTGAFSGFNPIADWICAPGEQPEALYVWLVYMPCSFARLLAAIADAIAPLAKGACPMFSRSINQHSAKLQREAGFMRACDLYPQAASDLVVVLPVAELQPQNALHRPTTQIMLARNIEQIFQVFSVRSATYMAEQFCLYSEEFDGNDFCATHFLGMIDGDAAGCVRLRFFNGFAKLERLAVRAEYRQSRLSYQLVRAAIEHCQKKGYRRILGHSRLDLVRFWKVFGFKPIENKALFAFANVQYAEILLEMEPSTTTIAMGVDPMVILRPEGAWEKPGPFETSPIVDDPLRKRLLEERTRTVGRQKIVS
jgi:predicted GNAT family N-acyltransferase